MIGELATAVAATALAVIAHFVVNPKRKGRGISVIIPFRASMSQMQRIHNLLWLLKYWRASLPGAEVVVGKDPDQGKPFSKSAAVNNGVARTRGDILVIVDADGFIDAESVLHCAGEIRAARKRGQKLWFVPYRRFLRLTEAATRRLLASDPRKPLAFPSPLPQEDVLGGSGSDPTIGHWYGAMIQICPREAFEAAGGWDERFRGWGGEDHAAMRAMDTLWWPHKTLPGRVLHMWHPQISPEGEREQVHWKNRMWAGQEAPGANDALAGRYYGAYRSPERMRKLVDEGKQGSPVDGGVNSPRRSSV